MEINQKLKDFCLKLQNDIKSQEKPLSFVQNSITLFFKMEFVLYDSPSKSDKNQNSNLSTMSFIRSSVKPSLSLFNK